MESKSTPQLQHQRQWIHGWKQTEDMFQEISLSGHQLTNLDSSSRAKSQEHNQRVFYKTNQIGHFDQGQHVILNVRNGGHYVLMTSYSGDTFHVNDPGNFKKIIILLGYSVTTYPLSGITNAAIYT